MTELPLRDIHLPDPISWWPPAIGWWILLGVICVGIFVLVRMSRPSLKKEALKALHRIEKEFIETGDAEKSMSELSVLFRRVVVSQNDSMKSGGVTGNAWLALLDKQINEPEFSNGVGQILLTGPYQRKIEKKNVCEIIKLCRKWVKHL